MPTKGTISGHYGRTVTGPNGNKISHPGVDIAAPEGTPIVAPDNSKVHFAGAAGTAGNLVELITADGVKHRFMHMSKILVQQGAEVKKGQTVGLVGNTGFSRGAHLHWEKYASGKQVNPIAE
jgi:murein DD-endopeptidase MepM/ murein hydrolase activator NlpD